MPTIANAPSGEDTSSDGTEKIPVSGNKFLTPSTIAEYIRTLTQTLTNKTLTTPTIGSFTNANHTHAASGATGGRVTAAPYVLVANHNLFSPADATTYFFGHPTTKTSLVTAALSHKIFIPQTATLSRADIIVFNNGGTQGTTETSTISFRLNDTTDTSLTTSLTADAASGASKYFNITGLSTAVTVGDFFEIKWVTPTWATNPTNVMIGVSLYFI